MSFLFFPRLDASADVTETYPEKKEVGVGRTAEGPATCGGEQWNLGAGDLRCRSKETVSEPWRV